MNSAARFARGLGALTVIVAVVVGVPALLVSLGLVPNGLPTVDEVVSTLGARDDGQVLRGALGAGAWACWLVFTLATAAELWAVMTARPAPRLPGLSAVQAPVTVLVAAVLVGFSLSATGWGTAAVASSAERPSLPMASARIALAGSTAAPPAPTARPDQVVQEHPVYVVQRRDTLWALAERHLRDPLRYPEIVTLNAGVIGPDNRITPGMSLIFPLDAVGIAATNDQTAASAASSTDVVVEPGDSLWSITQQTTGDGDDWPVVWEANQGRTEPGGAVFSDPDLLRAGWTVTVPGATQTSPPPSVLDVPPASEPSSPTTTSVPPSSSTPTSSPSATPSPSEASAQTETAAPSPTPVVESHNPMSLSDADDVAPVIAAVGAASALSAVSLLALRRYRRRQFRRRRPGSLLPTLPPQLAATERVLTARDGVDVAWLDETLRRLVADRPDLPVPDLVAACVTADAITIVLSEPTAMGQRSWTADESGKRWTLQRTAESSRRVESLGRRHAPFPCLVAVGSTPLGQHWFLDLERAGVLSIAGDADRAEDLLRYIAAELANNPWSEMLTVSAVGLGDELASLNPDRLTVHDSAGSAVTRFARCLQERSVGLRTQRTDALHARAGDLQTDAWDPRVLLLARGHGKQALHTAGELGTRAGLALVVLDDERAEAMRVEIDGAGVLTIPDLDLTLAAHQLPADEAAPLAQLLAHVAGLLEAEQSDIEIQGGGHQIDRDDVTSATADTRSSGVGVLVDSVLPLRDAAYFESAATTVRDMQVLAPAATNAGRRRSVEQDPHLDQDLADWYDEQCSRPKLTLLGPVRVEASGKLPERNPRRQFYSEVVAYLATRPAGATSEQYATALWPDEPDVIGKTKVRQSISVVRTWLGTDAEGADYLPSGLTAAAGGRYRILGSLIDADLFRRLRARGVALGADGVTDLEHALELVGGRPFERPDLRVRGVGGYGWLLDDVTRMDLELSAQIVDVAHVVATHHLGNGDPERAASAANTALRSGTFEDVPLLDLVAACDAMGNRAEADAYVVRILANHDADVEEDLPPRTAEVLFRRDRR